MAETVSPEPCPACGGSGKLEPRPPLTDLEGATIEGYERGCTLCLSTGSDT